MPTLVFPPGLSRRQSWSGSLVFPQIFRDISTRPVVLPLLFQQQQRELVMSDLEQLKTELAAVREELKAHQVLLTVLLSTIPIDNRVEFTATVGRINRDLYPPDGVNLGRLHQYVLVRHPSAKPKPRNP